MPSTAGAVDSPGAGRPAASNARDPRFDLFRGLALLMIFNLHLYGSRFTAITLGAISFCTGAEIFVFISGYVCGMVYLRKLQKAGLGSCQLKAIRRCGQLYGAHLLTFLACLALFVHFVTVWGTEGGVFRLRPLLDDPLAAGPRALLLMYTPLYMDILKLYIMLLLPLPLFLCLYRRRPWMAVGVSVLLYAIAQIWPLETALPDYPAGQHWFWNPLAWQMLFFLAVALGADKARGISRVPRGVGWGMFALALLVGLLVLKQTADLPWRAVDKFRLAPMRVISLFVMAWVIAAWAPATARLWRSRLLAPIICCGRHALPVFCFSVLLDYTGSLLLLETGGGAALELLLSAGGIALMCLLAAALARRRREAARVPAVTVEARESLRPAA
ncbi:MAG: OpgC domain-containing protein [Planctomycetota bacterium]|nr:OpgC domain-containing protein [Planctomycetota bacterium]